jgi:hypothetical protein
MKFKMAADQVLKRFARQIRKEDAVRGQGLSTGPDRYERTPNRTVGPTKRRTANHRYRTKPIVNSGIPHPQSCLKNSAHLSGFLKPRTVSEFIDLKPTSGLYSGSGVLEYWSVVWPPTKLSEKLGTFVQFF